MTISSPGIPLDPVREQTFVKQIQRQNLHLSLELYVRRPLQNQGDPRLNNCDTTYHLQSLLSRRNTIQPSVFKSSLQAHQAPVLDLMTFRLQILHLFLRTNNKVFLAALQSWLTACFQRQ